jgi:hypothetical protein
MDTTEHFRRGYKGPGNGPFHHRRLTPTVTSNRSRKGAYLAYETFEEEDSLVDVSPFTPVSWHPDYRYSEFATGPDSTGFVLDTADGGSLIYRHKPGVEYPVTCRLIAKTNLEWRDYEFKDTIIVPDDAAYDTVQFGLVFYYVNEDSTYTLTFSDGTAKLSGGGLSDTALAFTYSPGDTITTTVVAQSLPVNDIPDQSTYIEVSLGSNGGDEATLYRPYDSSNSRLNGGYAGVWVDLSGVASPDGVEPLSVRRALIRRKE